MLSESWLDIGSVWERGSRQMPNGWNFIKYSSEVLVYQTFMLHIFLDIEALFDCATVQTLSGSFLPLATWLGSPRAAATTRSRYSPPGKQVEELVSERKVWATKEKNEANGRIAKSPSSRLCAPGYNLEIKVDGGLRMTILFLMNHTSGTNILYYFFRSKTWWGPRPCSP